MIDDRIKRAPADVQLEEELQQSLEEKVHGLVRSVHRRFGDPSPETFFEDVAAAMGQTVRMDASVARHVHLPPITPGDVGKTVVVVLEGAGTAGVTVHAGADATINGSASVALAEAGESGIFQVTDRDLWVRLGGAAAADSPYRCIEDQSNSVYNTNSTGWAGFFTVRIWLDDDLLTVSKLRMLYEVSQSGFYSPTTDVRWTFGGVTVQRLGIAGAGPTAFADELVPAAYTGPTQRQLIGSHRTNNGMNTTSLRYPTVFTCWA